MRAMPTPTRRCAAMLLLGATLLTGCGKSLPVAEQSHGVSVVTVAGTGGLGVSGLATKNTTRLGGASPVADAAAVALATYPGLTPGTRPQAVVVVDDRDWSAALAASALAGAPLRAPLLYGEGGSLPALSTQALATLKPTGAAALGGAQVIVIGPITPPTGYRALKLNGRAGEPSSGESAGASQPAGGAGASSAHRAAPGGASAAPETAQTAQNRASAALAAQVERLVAKLQGAPPRRVLIAGVDGPPALAMPAASLAAESGVPVLPVEAAKIPPATRRVLARLRHPTIYAMGPPAAVSHAMLAELARLGAVRRIYPAPGASGASGPGTSGEDPASNAIAAARFSDGSFGWGVEQPGHGLVFATASRPLDAPAAAPLAASGDYAPLLLLERSTEVPSVLREYLSDIQPAYGNTPEYQPVHGEYNHGWLIGDDSAITPTVQAELDAMLEIAPQSSSTATSPTAPSNPTAPSSIEP